MARIGHRSVAAAWVGAVEADQTDDETPSGALLDFKVRRPRTGKIARLPITIRTEINVRLRNGQTGGQILPWLNGLPDVQAVLGALFDGDPINAENLSQWRRGGYADWLSDRDEIDDIRDLSAFSVDLANAAGGHLAAGPLARLTGKLHLAIEQADLKSLPDLIEAATKLRKQEIDAAKVALDKVKTDQKAAELALATDKFQRQTAEMFLKFARSKEAQDILSSAKPQHAKAKLIQTLMFGDQGKREAVIL